MKYFIYTYFFLTIILAISSCSNKQYQALFEQKNLSLDSISQKYSSAASVYHIRPFDLLEVRNLQDIKYIVNESTDGSIGSSGSAQGQTFEVKEDGTLTLPVIGQFAVAGLTRIEVTRLIEDKYRKVLLKDPIIEVKITNLKVTIYGEVKGPGAYPLTKDKISLVEMLGVAGGLTERANETNIKIIRGSQKNPQVIVIDLSNIQAINDPRTILQNSDVIYIAENKRAIRNDKISNFSSIFQPAILLFNTVLIIVSLIRH